MSGTGTNSKPWTVAMKDFIADGEWHDTKDVLAVGIPLVPEDRAEHEMGRSAGRFERTDMLERGRKNVCLMALAGMVRFHNAVWDNPKAKCQIRSLEASAKSPGALAAQVDALQAIIDDLGPRVEALEAFRDFVESRTGEQAASELFESAERSVASAG